MSNYVKSGFSQRSDPEAFTDNRGINFPSMHLMWSFHRVNWKYRLRLTWLPSLSYLFSDIFLKSLNICNCDFLIFPPLIHGGRCTPPPPSLFFCLLHKIIMRRMPLWKKIKKFSFTSLSGHFEIWVWKSAMGGLNAKIKD